MLQSIGANELLLIIVIVILFFGSKKIPQLFKSLGEAFREFKKASKDPELKE